MQSYSIARRAILNCLDWDLIKTTGPYFLLLVGVFNFVEIPVFTLLSIPAAPLFTVILLTALRCKEDKEDNVLFLLSNRKILFLKAWKVFSSGLLSGIFIFLGLCLFVIPGIILSKRYIYVAVIAEKEMLGPIACMRKSRDLSLKNGWGTLLALLYYGLFMGIAIISVSLIFSIPIEIVKTSNLFGFILDWVSLIAGCSISYAGYRKSLTLI